MPTLLSSDQRRSMRGSVSRRLRAWLDRTNKRDFVQFGLRGLILPLRVRHLSGPREIRHAENELILLSVVRNGAVWLQDFLAHHRRIGIKHFVILDNGSEDESRSICASEPDVTLLGSSAPYHAYENTFKRYLANRYARGTWCLFVDADELFDYPFSATLSIEDLISYCENNRYNAVITQMLDMFDDDPIQKHPSKETTPLTERYNLYDISGVRTEPYRFAPTQGISMHRGGIRNTLFGTDNGLTKVSLFKVDGALQPFVEWHHARNARLADFSCVLLHYPFAGSFAEKVRDAVRTGRYGHLTSSEYQAYLKAIEANPRLCLRGPQARTFRTVDELICDGFLVVSSRFEKWASEQGGCGDAAIGASAQGLELPPD